MVLNLIFRQPSIVKLINWNARNFSLWLQYVGPDLSTFADAEGVSTLSGNLQNRICLDVGHGIEYMHAQRIVHLDIKPANILLGEDGRAVLCDFGSSARRALDPAPYTVGTPWYIPPEYLFQDLRGLPGDIWALGITMLFVHGLMPLKRGCFIIAAVPIDLDVQQQMADWLLEIQQHRDRLPRNLSCLRAMLTEEAEERITARQLVSDLIASQAAPRREPVRGLLLAA